MKTPYMLESSIHGLCKVSQDNPMMMRFVRDEMIMKKIPLVCNPIVTFSTLVSCIINPKKNFDHQLFQLILAWSFSIRSTNVVASTFC
jgi:hypothetical protein